MNKLIYLWLGVKTLLCTCQSDQRINDFEKVRSHYKISKIGTLPAVVSESSGMAPGEKKNTFWTHNDSGGKPALYLIGGDYKLLETKSVPDAENIDWEDMARGESGHLYIGDIGNNSRPRNAFTIYRFDPARDTTQKITFNYAAQKDADISSKTPKFDSEAFFYHRENLYLFSKNWGKDQMVKLYKLPAKEGNYSLNATDSIRINSQVTAADISPDGKTFALLTYGKILLFEVSGQDINFNKPTGCFRFSKKQTEALMFLNSRDMLVTNEQGDIYRITYR